MPRFALTRSTLDRIVLTGTGLVLSVLPGCGNSSSTETPGRGTAGVAGQAGAGGGHGGSSSSGGAPTGGTPAGSGAFAGGAAGSMAFGGGGQGLGGTSGATSQGGTTQLGGAGLGSGGGAGAGAGGSDAGKVTLFDGTGLSQWRSKEGGETAPWTATSNDFAVVPGSGDITTRESFGDIKLHVEFWVPSTPATNGEQDRGNSGVYLQGRYEVQVLDSYNHPLEGANDCGAIYELKNADLNAAMPPETWQTYEISFRAPRWNGTQKVESARISVVWNGQVAQADVEVPAPTKLGDPEGPGDAPLRLQDHSHAVRYRNIWLQRM